MSGVGAILSSVGITTRQAWELRSNATWFGSDSASGTGQSGERPRLPTECRMTGKTTDTKRDTERPRLIIEHRARAYPGQTGNAPKHGAGEGAKPGGRDEISRTAGNNHDSP